jgi:hypothetical protein
MGGSPPLLLSSISLLLTAVLLDPQAVMSSDNVTTNAAEGPAAAPVPVALFCRLVIPVDPAPPAPASGSCRLYVPPPDATTMETKTVETKAVVVLAPNRSKKRAPERGCACPEGAKRHYCIVISSSSSSSSSSAAAQIADGHPYLNRQHPQGALGFVRS